MPVHNIDIAAIFNEIADFLEIEGENPFRIRAYRNAAHTLSGLGTELKDMAAANEDLTKLPGIGKELAAKINEILETGTAKALIKLQQRIPKTVIEMLKLPNLGPKRVRILYQDLKIKNLEQLSKAARKGRIRTLEGFGQKTEKAIVEAIEARAQKEKRFKIAAVKPSVDSLIDFPAECTRRHRCGGRRQLPALPGNRGRSGYPGCGPQNKSADESVPGI